MASRLDELIGVYVMNDDNENVLIIAYNLFCTILIPAVIVLTGIWSLESESDFTH